MQLMPGFGVILDYAFAICTLGGCRLFDVEGMGIVDLLLIVRYRCEVCQCRSSCLKVGNAANIVSILARSGGGGCRRRRH